jgi:hypothetical protein
MTISSFPANIVAVQFQLSDFGFEMQESSDLEISLFYFVIELT